MTLHSIKLRTTGGLVKRQQLKKLNISKLHPWMKIGAMTTEARVLFSYKGQCLRLFLEMPLRERIMLVIEDKRYRLPTPPLSKTGPHELWFGSWSVERNCKK